MDQDDTVPIKYVDPLPTLHRPDPIRAAMLRIVLAARVIPAMSIGATVAGVVLIAHVLS